MAIAAGLVLEVVVAEVVEVVHEVSHFRVANFNSVLREKIMLLDAGTLTGQFVGHQWFKADIRQVEDSAIVEGSVIAEAEAEAEDVVHQEVEVAAVVRLEVAEEVSEPREAQRLSSYVTDDTIRSESTYRELIRDALILQEPHRHAGVFVARGKEDLLVTKNLNPGESVYGEKRISVENSANTVNGDDAAPATKTEYRVWNPFRSKLAAGILGGLDEIFIRPGAKVLYLGAASGTSVSHVADIVGPTGIVFAVEFSHRSGRDLINMATHRTNVIPIIEDARHPLRYRMLVSMVDVIFADVAQPDQARIVGLNAHLYLKVGGGVVVSIKANCIDSTAAPEAVFAREVTKMREERIKPLEQLTLEPFERGKFRCTHAFTEDFR